MRRFYLLVLILASFAFRGIAGTWYTTTAGGGLNTLANWWSTPGGTGTHPGSFTSPGDFFVIQGPMTTASGWTVGVAGSPYYGGAVIIDSGGSITNTCSGCSLYIYDTLDMNGAARISSTVYWYPYLYGYTNMSGTSTITNTGSYYYLYNYGVMNMSGNSVITDSASYYYIYNYYNGSTPAIWNMSGSSKVTIGTSTDYYFYNYGNVNIGGNAVMNGYEPIIYDYGVSASAGGIFSVSGNAEIGGSNYITLYGYGTYTNTAGYYFTGNSSLTATSEVEVYGSDPFTFSFNSTGALCTTGSNYWYNEASSSSVTNPCLIQVVAGSGPTNMYWYNYYTTEMIGNVNIGNDAFYNETACTLIGQTYVMSGTGHFFDEGTIWTQHPLGLNGMLQMSPPSLPSNGIYKFNGTNPQVTGTLLPASLSGTLIIANTSGSGSAVSLSQSTWITGLLQFTNGILNTTPSYTLTASGAPGAITGAGPTTYVKGTLMETISGYSSLTYPVGDTDYTPVTLTLSSAGTAGDLGLKPTYGMHPAVASSGIYTTNIANHYWTIINSGAAGPATVIPKVTYNAGDIIGTVNTSFVTQKYSGTAWLGSALTTTNTASPYTSAPTSGIALASLAGQYIFGSSCPVVAPATGATVCAPFTATFVDNGTWGGLINDIKVNMGAGLVDLGAPGASGCYTLTVNTAPALSTITFNPACLATAGLYTIDVYVPAGYGCGTAVFLQPVGACSVSCGTPTALTVSGITTSSAIPVVQGGSGEPGNGK